MARIGDAGGIAVGGETVYGSASASKVWQHAISASMADTRPLIKPATLGQAYHSSYGYGVGSSSGEIVVAYDDSRAVIGPILNLLGTLSTNDYVFGAGTAPENDSMTLLVNVGGHQTEYRGVRANALRWSIQPDTELQLTASLLGYAGIDDVADTVTAPAESGIIWESDISTMTVGGTSLCVLSGEIAVESDLVGADRHCLGGSNIKKPELVGRYTVTGTLNCELSDDTGQDSEALLTLWRAGSALGDIVMGDFAFTGCYMTGDTPALGPGITQIPINFEAQYLTLTTTA